MRTFYILFASVLVSMLGACGPNILTAKGKVMNPLIKDSKELAFNRYVTIVRKEPRITGGHYIVGNYKKPRALDELHETAEIPPQNTDGTGLLVTFELYSVYKEELVHLTKNYTFWMILPDGRRIKGSPHRVWGLVNLSEKVSGGSMQRHLVVKDKRRGIVRSYSHWEEVENDYELFWRKIRVVFLSRDLITLETTGIVLEVHGEQRIRRYVVDFANDPTELMSEKEKADYLEEKSRE